MKSAYLVALLPLFVACAEETPEDVASLHDGPGMTVVKLQPDGTSTVERLPAVAAGALTTDSGRCNVLGGLWLRGPLGTDGPLFMYDEICFMGVGRANLADYPMRANKGGVFQVVGTWADGFAIYRTTNNLHGYFRDGDGNVGEFRRESASPSNLGTLYSTTVSTDIERNAKVIVIDIANQAPQCLTPAQACGSKSCGTVSNGCGGEVSCEGACIVKGPGNTCNAAGECVCSDAPPSCLGAASCEGRVVTNRCGQQRSCPATRKCSLGMMCCPSVTNPAVSSCARFCQ